MALRGAVDGELSRGLGAAFTEERDGALRAIGVPPGEATLILEGTARTIGLEREGELAERLRLGAALRLMARELPAGRELAFGELITGRERLTLEREADRLADRAGADRLVRGAERLGEVERPLLREAEGRPPPPLERDWAAASGAVKASARAATIVARVEVHARFVRAAADIVRSPLPDRQVPGLPSGPLIVHFL